VLPRIQAWTTPKQPMIERLASSRFASSAGVFVRDEILAPAAQHYWMQKNLPPEALPDSPQQQIREEPAKWRAERVGYSAPAETDEAMDAPIIDDSRRTTPSANKPSPPPKQRFYGLRGEPLQQFVRGFRRDLYAIRRREKTQGTDRRSARTKPSQPPWLAGEPALR